MPAFRLEMSWLILKVIPKITTLSNDTKRNQKASSWFFFLNGNKKETPFGYVNKRSVMFCKEMDHIAHYSHHWDPRKPLEDKSKVESRPTVIESVM